MRVQPWRTTAAQNDSGETGVRRYTMSHLHDLGFFFLAEFFHAADFGVGHLLDLFHGALLEEVAAVASSAPAHLPFCFSSIIALMRSSAD